MPKNTFYNIIVTEREENEISPFVIAFEIENGQKKSIRYYELEYFLDALVKREDNINASKASSTFSKNYEIIDITDCGHLTNKNSGSNNSSSSSGGTGNSRDPNAPTNSDNGSYVSLGSYTVINYSGGGVTMTVYAGNAEIIGVEPVDAKSNSNDNRIICPEGEVIIIENIVIKITNKLTGKARCLNNLLDKSGNSYVKGIFSKFKGKSEFNIKIVSKDKVISKKTGKEVNGTTSSPVNNLITINISTSKADERSGLAVAKTILHEYIHADIYRKLKTKTPTKGELDFRKTYEAYENQHEAMGALYVSSMRDALKHFHKNVLKEDYNKYVKYYDEAPSDSFYEALAWRGLANHNVKAWKELSTEKKKKINNLSLRIDILTKKVTCSD